MVYSTLDIFTTVVSTRGRITYSIAKLVVGATHTPSLLLAAALTLLSRVHQWKVAVKTEKIEKFGPVAITTRAMSLAVQVK